MFSKPNRKQSKLLLGMYSQTSILSSPKMQQPKSLTRFMCWSLDMSINSFLNSISLALNFLTVALWLFVDLLAMFPVVIIKQSLVTIGHKLIYTSLLIKFLGLTMCQAISNHNNVFHYNKLSSSNEKLLVATLMHS